MASLSNRLPGLNFDLGEAADMLRDTVEHFAANEIAPRAATIDRDNAFPMELWRKFGDLGVLCGRPLFFEGLVRRTLRTNDQYRRFASTTSMSYS